jgi:hypothetical protein
MKSVTAMCCAMAFSAVTLSAAQSGTMDKDKMDKGEMGKGKNGGTVVMTGCVAEGAGNHYMLTNAMKIGQMKSQIKDDMKETSYDLVGGDLKAHVGHKVEVAGTTAGEKMMKDDKMDKMDKMDKDRMSGNKHPAITVKSVKMISTTCP